MVTKQKRLLGHRNEPPFFLNRFLKKERRAWPITPFTDGYSIVAPPLFAAALHLLGKVIFDADHF
ncbi:MAG: hypothetical protein ACPGR8_17535, partial [Limisphaerales bacterium]